MSTIIDFLKKGNLGAIKTGQDQNSVEKFLGPPEAIAYNKLFTTLKYECLQLTFYKVAGDDPEIPILKHIKIDFENNTRFPDAIKLTGWYPTPDTSYTDFVEEIKKHGINALEDKLHTFKSIQIGIKSDSGVVVIFDDENIENKIVSMSLFNPS